MNTTWTWDGTSWQQQNSTSIPTKNQSALLVYDGATQQTLLFGNTSVGGAGSSASDTWTWNGTEWVKVAAQGAPTDLFESTAYDEAMQAVIVYAEHGSIQKLGTPSSSSGFVSASQTWIWSGTTWKLLP